MGRVSEVSREELLRRRDDILDRLAVPYEEFQHRANSGGLVGDEWTAWEELQDIEFLLQDDSGTARGSGPGVR